jgi:hypothetical protein
LVVIVAFMVTGHQVPPWSTTAISLIAAAGLIATQIPVLRRVLAEDKAARKLSEEDE